MFGVTARAIVAVYDGPDAVDIPIGLRLQAAPLLDKRKARRALMRRFKAMLLLSFWWRTIFLADRLRSG
ncbi:hypothetical protein D9M69_671110 [compost metagenome]